MTTTMKKQAGALLALIVALTTMSFTPAGANHHGDPGYNTARTLLRDARHEINYVNDHLNADPQATAAEKNDAAIAIYASASLANKIGDLYACCPAKTTLQDDLAGARLLMAGVQNELNARGASSDEINDANIVVFALASLKNKLDSRPPVGGSGYVMLSPAEVQALGPIPQSVYNAAAGSVTAQLWDNNSDADANTWANALIAVKNNDQNARNKAIQGIQSLRTATQFDRSLQLARNLSMYAWAASLLDYHGEDDVFTAYLTKPLGGHSGGTNVLTTARLSASNWGAMASEAVLSVALLTGNTTLAQEMVDIHKCWTGDCRGPFNPSNMNSTWHYTSVDANKRGINPRGATKNGLNIDGVQPEDQRRQDPSTCCVPVANTPYPWEGLGPRVITAVIANHAGLLPNQRTGDDGIRRAVIWNYNFGGTTLSGDDRTWGHLLRRYHDLSYLVPAEYSQDDEAQIFKSGAFFSYTHAS